MIIKNTDGTEMLYIDFGQMAINNQYVDSILQMYIQQSKENKKIKIFVKTEEGSSELRMKDKDYLNKDDLKNFLFTVQKELNKELNI